jgi:hypothetical protein
MKASILYRISSILLLLLALGHLLGFRQSDPSWGVGTLLASMRSLHFNVQGFDRTYWDLFLAAGFAVGTLYIFLGILTWQLGSLNSESLARLRVSRWALAASFAVITFVSWQHLFVIPIVFSAVITLSLVIAALASAPPEAQS